jgi:hypothetical protein
MKMHDLAEKPDAPEPIGKKPYYPSLTMKIPGLEERPVGSTVVLTVEAEIRGHRKTDDERGEHYSCDLRLKKAAVSGAKASPGKGALMCDECGEHGSGPYCGKCGEKMRAGKED